MALAFRTLQRLARSVHTEAHFTPSTAISVVPPAPFSPSQTAHRDAHTSSVSDPAASPSPNVSEPSLNSSGSTDTGISLAPHPVDPSQSSAAGSSSSSSLHLPVPPDHPHLNNGRNARTSGPISPSTYQSPPFHTHQFFKVLEETFPTATARSLMRATRALLVDRIGRVQREGLTNKDLDNVSNRFIQLLYIPEHGNDTYTFGVWAVSCGPQIRSKRTCSVLLSPRREPR